MGHGIGLGWLFAVHIEAACGNMAKRFFSLARFTLERRAGTPHSSSILTIRADRKFGATL